MNNTPQRQYILYDSTAVVEGTEHAQVFVVCESNREAKSYRREFGAVACFSYALVGDELTDERFEWSWYPN